MFLSTGSNSEWREYTLIREKKTKSNSPPKSRPASETASDAVKTCEIQRVGHAPTNINFKSDSEKTKERSNVRNRRTSDAEQYLGLSELRLKISVVGTYTSLRDDLLQLSLTLDAYKNARPSKPTHVDASRCIALPLTSSKFYCFPVDVRRMSMHVMRATFVRVDEL